MREEVLGSARDRIQRIRSGDTALVLEPQAAQEIRQLRALLDEEINPEVAFALGWLLWSRHCATPDVTDDADVDAAIDAFAVCMAVDFNDLPEPLLPRVASAAAPYAAAMLERALDSSDAELANTTVHLWNRIANVTSEEPGHAGYLSGLGIALRVRFEREGDPADLHLAVRAGEVALQRSADDPERPSYLCNLGVTLGARYVHDGNSADLEASVQLLQEAVQVLPPDHGERAAYLSDLGGALRSRYGRNGDDGDLDAAVALGREAVALAPPGHPSGARYLSNLGVALQVRYARTGALEDLNETVVTGRVGLALLPAGHPSRPTMLGNHATALRTRFERTGNRRDLEEAIAAAREALGLARSEDPDRSLYLTNLGLALHTWFEHTADASALQEAVDHLSAAQQGTPSSHTDRAARLSNLGVALQSRFEQTGVRAHLDTAIERLQVANEATPSHHPNRPMYLSNLSIALQTRYERVGSTEDLNEAIDALRNALARTPPGHPDRPMYLSNLAAGLNARVRRTEGTQDLDAAVEASREAVERTPEGHTAAPARLSNLGIALRARFNSGHDPGDLDAAVDSGLEALRLVPTDRPERTSILSNLAEALHTRFERTDSSADLTSAVGYLQQAVQATPEDHPAYGLYQSNLGFALTALSDSHSAPDGTVDGAVRACLAAAGATSAAPSLRLRAAWHAAGLLAASDPQRAAHAATHAVNLLPQVVPRALDRGDQQHVLSRLSGLASDAAALALAASDGTAQDRARDALSLLETGRAVLLSQALDTRYDLADLREARPELAVRFIELRELLDQPTDAAPPIERRVAAAQVRRDLQEGVRRDRHKAEEQYRALVAEIREVPGLKSFARPPSLDELLHDAPDAPVVVFNVSRYGSSALLLADGGVTSVPLPDLTEESVSDKAEAFRTALRVAEEDDDADKRIEAQITLIDTLEWLWDVAAGPVLDSLGLRYQPNRDAHQADTKAAFWPRVWWAPGGHLGILPLHAAGYHQDSTDDPGRRTVMDRVVSSYAPTIRSLRYAREQSSRTAMSSACDRALIVAMPTTPGRPGRLDHAETEAAMLHARLPGSVLLQNIDNDTQAPSPPELRPTRENVLAHLGNYPVAHFACHGDNDPVDPSQSVLLLLDHEEAPLTPRSLAPVALTQARLAYLSACRTAVIDAAGLADEAIHLASAFQLAGFPHVIGTLWEVSDDIAGSVADMFYAALASGAGGLSPDNAALALHQTIRKIRDGHGLGPWDRTRTPSLWAGYLHAGA
ncbi:CHAT domain-containing protein [Streptomyces sp. NPDC020766]|uniref:CHAT domain-containing protein n=1 Tax=Streptomyces sp. NPDC020766 TaxID=3155011 RepID=UPI0033FA6AB9